MALLKPASNQTAFLKLGILGFEGSGKTYTAVDFAIGMTKLSGGKKVAFFDTEKGSDFHVDRFKKAGIQFDVVKSRSFKDLLDTIKEAEQGGYSFLIIDSITHVWRDLVDSWLRKKGRNFLTMKDWGVLKTEWSQYTNAYVNSKVNIAMLGRAGHEYDIDEDDDGNQEMKKSGTKMKVETETGYEPDLLLEMFKAPVTTKETTKKGTTKTTKHRGFVNKCFVLKDRTDTMNGREIEKPKFESFKSVIKFLNIGGEHVGAVDNNHTENAFKAPDFSYADKIKRRDIALESLQEALILGKLDGTSADSKQKRTELLIKHFTSSSKTFIEGLDPEAIEVGVRQIKIELGQIDTTKEPPILAVEEIPY